MTKGNFIRNENDPSPLSLPLCTSVSLATSASLPVADASIATVTIISTTFLVATFGISNVSQIINLTSYSYGNGAYSGAGSMSRAMSIGNTSKNISTVPWDAYYFPSIFKSLYSTGTLNFLSKFSILYCKSVI